MRSKLLTVAIAAGLGLTSFSALAATPKSQQQPAKVTVDAATLQQLQAQLAALQAQVADLESKAGSPGRRADRNRQGRQ